MKFNYQKLRGRIKEKCGTQDDFAEKMKIGRVSLSKRLNNQLDFSQDEIYRACKTLDIDIKDVSIYFFTPNV